MNTVMFGNEPRNELIQYFIHEGRAENRSAVIELGDYTNLADELEDELQRMTSGQVSRIGVKSLVGLGAYGFYVSQNEEGEFTRILLPINPDVIGGPPPTLVIGQTDTTLTYTIGNPEIIDYECFRLIFRRGLFAHEFITYELVGEVDKPFDMEGEYSVTCIGYRNEISEFSKPTEAVEIAVALRPDAPEPDLPDIPDDLEDIINAFIAYHNVHNQAHPDIRELIHSGGDLVSIVPAMTSNSSPAPFEASASSEWDTNYQAWRAFSSNFSPPSIGDCWASAAGSFAVNTGVGNAWLQIDCGQQKRLTRYSLFNRFTSADGSGPRDFSLLGSNDSMSWSVLDIQVDSMENRLGVASRRELNLASTANFRYYRLQITRTFGPAAGVNYTTVGQLQLWSAEI